MRNVSSHLATWSTVAAICLAGSACTDSPAPEEAPDTSAAQDDAGAEDPWLWLEEIEGEQIGRAHV